VINTFSLDWNGPSLAISLALCDNPPGFLVKEAAEIGLLPLSSLGSVLLKLGKSKDKALASITWNTLLAGLLFFGASATLVSPDGSAAPTPACCWMDSEFQKLFEATLAPIEEAPLFTLLAACIEYLDAIFELVEWDDAQKFELIAGGRFLAKLFPKQAVGLVKTVLRGFGNFRALEFASAMIQDWITPVEGRWFGCFAVEKFGPERAVATSKDVCLMAAEIDPVIARAVAPFLDQPLTPLPTFAAFADVDKHADWVQRCRETIPQTDWIIEQPPDESLIPDEAPLAEPVFLFVSPDIQPGIDGVFDGTCYSMVSYLTHLTPEFTRLLPVPIDPLEEFVLTNAADLRLVIGFFFYAFYARYQTQKLREWTEILTHSKTDPEIYAVSLFLNSLRINAAELSPLLHAFITKHLLYHGHPTLTADRLSYAFHKEHGVKWFFVRSIINIDPAQSAPSPLVRAEFAAPSQVLPLFQAFLRTPESKISVEAWVTCFVALISVFLRPPLGVPSFPFPVSHPALTALPPAPQAPQRIRLDPALLDALFVASERPRGLPICFFQLFFHLQLEPPQRA
jgi:hypothetical protein